MLSQGPSFRKWCLSGSRMFNGQKPRKTNRPSGWPGGDESGPICLESTRSVFIVQQTFCALPGARCALRAEKSQQKRVRTRPCHVPSSRSPCSRGAAGERKQKEQVRPVQGWAVSDAKEKGRRNYVVCVCGSMCECMYVCVVSVSVSICELV